MGGNDLQLLTNGFKIILSSYSQAINKQEKLTGNLFQQKTKAKCLDDESGIYPIQTFHYIHQNAWRAKIVNKIEVWKYSSFPDYLGLRNGTLCNKNLAIQLLNINSATLYKESYEMIPDEIQRKIMLI